MRYADQTVSEAVQGQIKQNAPLPAIDPVQVDEVQVAQGEDLIDSVNLELPELGSQGKTPAGEQIKQFIIDQLGGFDVFKRAEEARTPGPEVEGIDVGVGEDTTGLA